MSQNNKYAKASKNKAIICFILTSLLVLSVTIISCFAQEYTSAKQTYPFSESGKELTNTYMLVVCTGTSADSDEIGYFEIKYIDKDNIRRTEILTLKESMQYAYDLAKSASDTESAEKTAITTLNSKFNVRTITKQDVVPMSKGNTDFLACTLPAEIDTLVSINFLCVNNGTEKCVWPCSSLKLYKVNKIYGGMYNNDIGGNYSVVFDGSMIAKYADSSGYNFSWTDNTLVTLSENNSKKEWRLQTSGFTNDETKFSNLSDRYYIELDIADVFGSGIESFAYENTKDSDSCIHLEDLYISETLCMKINYTDSSGRERIVTVPVVSAYYKLLNQVYGEYMENLQIEGIFQAGNTVVFQVFMHDMKEIKKITLSYSPDNSSYESTYSYINKEVRVHSDDDKSFSCSAIRFSSAGKAVAKYQYDGTRPVATIDGDSTIVYTYIASSRSGTKISKDGSATLTPKKYVYGNKTEAALGNNTYLISITTDSVESAGTINDVYLTLNYKTKNGLEKSTKAYNLSEACADYYGEWPVRMEMNDIRFYDIWRTCVDYDVFSADRYNEIYRYGAKYSMAPAKSVAYMKKMQSGQTLNIIMNINDVKTFESAEFRLDGADEWQMKSLTIKQLSSLSERHISFCEDCDKDGELLEMPTKTVTTNRTIEEYNYITSCFKSYTGRNTWDKDNVKNWYRTEYDLSNYDLYVFGWAVYFTKLEECLYTGESGSKQLNKYFRASLAFTNSELEKAMGSYDNHYQYDIYKEKGEIRTCATDITRDYHGVDCVKYKNNMLLQKEDTKIITFSSTDTQEKEADWEEYSQSMDYEDTKYYLGFEKTRATYQVDVQVGNYVDNTGDNGDCGSKNQFYFQLVFENGCSGYVLANQQLSADGFRTGEKESFVIRVNRDYGELQSVHIIPENPNSQEDAYDKLNIDYIEITKVEDSGLCKKWKVDIDDWISIKYVDSATQDSIEGQTPSTESDLAQIFMVTSSGYSVTLLFAIATAAQSGGPKIGNISATIEYVDTDGYTKTKDLDITEYIYNYAGLTYNNMTFNNISYAKNDATFMFKPAHIDRFTYSISDLVKLNSVTFYVISDENYTWVIDNVGVYIVNESGQITLNANNEYERTGEKTQLTSTDSAKQYEVKAEANKKVKSAAINFIENEFKVEESSGGTTAKVTYVPQNQNDTVNIYVYMQKDGSALSEYDMDSSIVYNVDTEKQSDGTALTGVVKAKNVTLKADKENMMFYATGVKTSGITSVSKILLKADSSSTLCIPKVDYVLIERVRSGVIIDTDKFVFAQNNAMYDYCEGTPDINGTENQKLKQVVCFTVGDKTKATLLKAQTDDLAVSITYLSMTGSSSHQLTSPNKFIAENDILQVMPGGVYKLEFDMKNCSGISKLNFVAMGDLINNISIKNAYAATYTVDSDGKETCTGWYSFSNSTPTIKGTTRSMTVTTDMSDTSGNNDNVAELTLKIKTVDLSEDMESGTACPVNMILGYTDDFGDAAYALYTNIESIATTGTTQTGDTLEMKLLVNGFREIRSVQFEPTTTIPGDDTTWKIESVKLDYVVDGKTKKASRKVDAVAQEGAPLTVNLCNVELNANVFSANEENGTSISSVATNLDTEPVSFVIKSGREVTVTPTVNGSTQGIDFKCYRIVDGLLSEDTVSCTVFGTSDTVRSVVFNSSTVGTYKLVFTSKEFASITTTVYITIEEEVTTTEATTEETTQETTAEETTNKTTETTEKTKG